jgi:hypothetical protein
MDARADFEPLLEAFGVPATVTRPAPDDTPIETTGIWLEPQFLDEPGGSPFARREAIRVFAVRKEDVPTLLEGHADRGGGARRRRRADVAGRWDRAQTTRTTRERTWCGLGNTTRSDG